VTISTDDDSSTASSPWRTIGLGVVLVLAVFVAYLPSLNGGFVCDDWEDVVGNPALHSWDGLCSLWATPGTTAQYYPLSFTTYWLNYQADGLDPLGYHLVNVLFHAINALLLWQIVRAMKIPGAWLAAALFALHPVNVESVAYIDERKNVLSGFFFFCALLAAIRFWLTDETMAKASRKIRTREEVPPAGGVELEGLSKITHSPAYFALKHLVLCVGASVADWTFYGLTVVLYVCALLSKTAVLPLPAVIWLMVWWRRKPTRRDVLFLLPLAAVGVAMGLLTLRLERHLVEAASLSLWHLSLPQRFLLAGRAFWFYLGKWFWPHPLIFTYPRWNLQPSHWLAWLPLLAFAAAAAMLWRHRPGRARPVLFALAYFVAMLFLMLGFFNINMFRYTFVCDHFQYLAGVGALTLMAAAITTAWQRLPGVSRSAWAGSVGVAALLLLLGTLTWRQASVYADAETLWQTTLAMNPDCPLAAVALGADYYQDKRVEAAMDMDRRAIRLAPDLYEAWNNLGVCLAYKGLNDQAMADLAQALNINPGYKNSIILLAALLDQSARYPEEIALYERSLGHGSDLPLMYNNLAWLLATCPDAKFRDGQRAVSLAEHACELSHYSDPDLVRTLSAAYAEAGRFTNAITSVALAEQLASENGKTVLAVKSYQLLQLYQAGQPYHEPAPTNNNAKF